jgi:hypothetical protein
VLLSARARRTVVVVAGVVGVGALYGGTRLLVDAEALGLRTSWLDGTPFPDYRVPAVLLIAVIGGGMLVTALAVLLGSRFSRLAAFAMGVILLVWGVVETLAIGYQGVGQLLLVGVFVIAPALALLRVSSHRRDRSTSWPAQRSSRE